MTDKANPTQTPANTVTGDSYAQAVAQTKAQWDNVVDQQFKQAGIRRQKAS